MRRAIAVFALLLSVQVFALDISPPIRLTPAEHNLSATYRITAITDHGKGACTGFAISKREILSAGHCAAREGVTFFLDEFDADGIQVKQIALHLVRFIDPDESPDHDLALFKTDEDLPHFTPLKYGEIKLGQWCYTIGARYGEAPSCVGWGIFAAKTTRDFPGLWLAAIDSAPGNSGGPVFNSKHEFIGVLVRGAPSIILFVPAATVKAFIEGTLTK